MPSTPTSSSALIAIDIEALFASALPVSGDALAAQVGTAATTGPLWPTRNCADLDQWASPKANSHAGLRDAGPLGPLGPAENRRIDAGLLQTLGSGGSEELFRAASSARPVRRPALNYRLNDAANSGGLLIGMPGDTISALVQELQNHYGDRLDLESIRASFSAPCTPEV